MFLVRLCVSHMHIAFFSRVWQKTIQSRTISGIQRGFKSFLGSQVVCVIGWSYLLSYLFSQSTAHGLCGFGKQKWQWAASPGNANNLRPRQYLVLHFFFSIPTWRKWPWELEKWAMLPLADSLPSSVARGWPLCFPVCLCIRLSAPSLSQFTNHAKDRSTLASCVRAIGLDSVSSEFQGFLRKSHLYSLNPCIFWLRLRKPYILESV